MTIQYPPFFEQVLQRDRSLRAGVDTLTTAFQSWLNSSRLPFFTDYTDHGIDHLNCVLATADNLITEQARNLLTPSDAAVLIAATLLHDAAMHLSEAGFHSLIRGQASSWNITEFSERPWPTLWDDYLFSAKRWDESRLREVLGETPSGELRAHIRDPFSNYDDLSDTDRKLIGEFIRAHHPRMAHEFACKGVPGKSLIEFASTLGTDLLDIAGLVARSHGLPVRACMNYLKRKYHKREYKGVHAVYLMTLLRVSDYLQIQQERAPAIVFEYRHIPSKISELEWKAHQAIRNITQTHDDPESIEIQAQPKDVVTYIRLKEWLSGIQAELDSSWAVLGETYGAHAKLSHLGLILRRVRSNLDQKDVFSRQVEYVPEQIELTVARPDLLKLLVGPLYENVPSIGIRELIQNAVDAVLERKVLQEHHPDLRDVPLLQQENDVEIWLEDLDETGHSCLTVSDRGAGMSVEIIRDYFLTAGASFRNSDAWKREFETDGTASHSKVLRSGRFGVGVLAGFLLGSRMEIATRHIKSPTGIRFRTTLDLNTIELQHDASLRVGTSIRIQVSDLVRRQLLESGARVNVPAKFDWFVYTRPSVVRFVGNDRTPMEQSFAVVRPAPDCPTSLRRLRGSDNYAVYWTFEPLPNLSVNGIFISNSSKLGFRKTRSRTIYSSRNDGLYFTVNHPRICVEDPDGLFPLNLQRSDITLSEYPFMPALRQDIMDDFLAFLIVNCPDAADGMWSAIPEYPGLHFEDTKVSSRVLNLHLNHLIANSEGISLLSPHLGSDIMHDNVFIVLRPNPLGLAAPIVSPNSLVACLTQFDDNHLRRHYTESFKWPVKLLRADRPFLAALEVFKDIRIGIEKERKSWLNQLLGARVVQGARLHLPSRIAKKVADCDEWVAEARKDYEAIRNRNALGYMLDYERFDFEEFLNQICDGLEVDAFDAIHSSAATKGCPKTRLARTSHHYDADFCIIEIFLAPQSTQLSRRATDKMGPITERWKEIFGQVIIPFDPVARRNALSGAYSALDHFIQTHEAMKRNGQLF